MQSIWRMNKRSEKDRKKSAFEKCTKFLQSFYVFFKSAAQRKTKKTPIKQSKKVKRKVENTNDRWRNINRCCCLSLVFFKHFAINVCDLCQQRVKRTKKTKKKLIIKPNLRKQWGHNVLMKFEYCTRADANSFGNRLCASFLAFFYTFMF